MEVRAVAKYVKVQPRKVRIIADELRGKNALHSVSLLRYHTSKSAKALHKVLISAMANAAENHGVSAELLKINTIQVDEGPRQKRMRARAMGRGNQILKKTSHITVVVEDFEPVPVVKHVGTKPKPRPTFGNKGKKKATTAAVDVAAVEAPAEVKEEVIVETPAVETAEAAPVEVAAEESVAAEVATEETAAEEAPAAEEETN